MPVASDGPTLGQGMRMTINLDDASRARMRDALASLLELCDQVPAGGHLGTAQIKRIVESELRSTSPPSSVANPAGTDFAATKAPQARVSPDGDVARYFDYGADVVQGWLMLHVVDQRLTLTHLTDDEVADWTPLLPIEG